MATKKDEQKKKIRIQQVRSGIGCPRTHKEALRALGFKRMHQVLERPDNPGVRGLVFKVRHLVEVVE